MSATKLRWCWRKDLAAFRGLTDFERSGFLLVLEWFENFRLRHEMEAGRDAAKGVTNGAIASPDMKAPCSTSNGVCFDARSPCTA